MKRLLLFANLLLFFSSIVMAVPRVPQEVTLRERNLQRIQELPGLVDVLELDARFPQSSNECTDLMRRACSLECEVSPFIALDPLENYGEEQCCQLQPLRECLQRIYARLETSRALLQDNVRRQRPFNQQRLGEFIIKYNSLNGRLAALQQAENGENDSLESSSRDLVVVRSECDALVCTIQYQVPQNQDQMDLAERFATKFFELQNRLDEAALQQGLDGLDLHGAGLN